MYWNSKTLCVGILALVVWTFGPALAQDASDGRWLAAVPRTQCRWHLARAGRLLERGRVRSLGLVEDGNRRGNFGSGGG